MSVFNDEAHVNIDGREVIFAVNESISHATLRTEDLVDAFEGWVEVVDPTGFKHLMKRKEGFLAEDNEFAEDYWLNEVVFEVMADYAPEGYYFGSHPGDGSDFGFWEDTYET